MKVLRFVIELVSVYTDRCRWIQLLLRHCSVSIDLSVKSHHCIVREGEIRRILFINNELAAAVALT
jgi:hypothetical protein